MIRMVKVEKKSVAFCKYAIAGLLWLAIILRNEIPIYIVFFIMLISAITGVHRAPLVKLFDITIGKKVKAEEVYINIHSMRFAHIVGCIFCILSLVSFYYINPIVALIITIVFALLQTIASFGYCSAQKLYECVVCNSNCCRFGKKIRRMKKNVR